jgi:TnpA family transposase
VGAEALDPICFKDRLGVVATHARNMIQVGLSIQAGRVMPSMPLRKLGSYSRKSLLYRAFRELGRVERTLFLLRHMSSAEVRRVIRAETTKIEAYNNYLDWVWFGGPVVKSVDPVEQEKQLICQLGRQRSQCSPTSPISLR